MEEGHANARYEKLRSWGWQVLGLVLLMMWAASGYFLHDLKPRTQGADEKRLRSGVDIWNAWQAQSGKWGGNLSGSDLSGMDFTGADFSGTKFYDRWSSTNRRTNLNEAIFRDVDFSGASVTYSLLVKADLGGANLRDASFSFSDLTDSNLSDVDAQGAFFQESDFSGANLTGSNFSEANFFRANFYGSQIAGVDFTGASLTWTNFGAVKDWEAIASIKCANIYGVQAPYAFKKWALNNGAVEYDSDRELRWTEVRDACLAQDVDEEDSTGSIP